MIMIMNKHSQKTRFELSKKDVREMESFESKYYLEIQGKFGTDLDKYHIEFPYLANKGKENIENIRYP